MLASESLLSAYPLSNLYFYLTEGCNLKCRHCWISPKYQATAHSYPALDVEDFVSIIHQAKPLGLSSVKLTGGEPLLHPHVDQLLDLIYSENLSLRVETNGMLCTPTLAAKIARCREAHVAVSLDGADAATHDSIRGVEGAFHATCEAIRHLVTAGCHPQIIMSIMRSNKEQIKALVDLAESLEASSVKFNIIQPIARGESIHHSQEMLSVQELVELGKWVDEELATTTDIQLLYDIPPAFKSLRHIFGNGGAGNRVCGVLEIMGVLSDGSYALCGIGTTVSELIFGHVKKDQLEDVWKKNPILQQLREGLPKKLEGVCSKCMMSDTCKGSCIAQNYYTSHNLWASFWFCEEAKKIGVFPVSRLKD